MRIADVEWTATKKGIGEITLASIFTDVNNWQNHL
jgi:hypothetical protein